MSSSATIGALNLGEDSDLSLRPIVWVGIGHIWDGIEVKRAMPFQEVLAMLLRERADHVLPCDLDVFPSS